MKINIWTFFYVVILVLILFFEYKKNDYSVEESSLHNYTIEENKALKNLFMNYLNPLNTNVVNSTEWGIKAQRVKEKAPKIILDLVEVKPKAKTICIKNSCYKFLGIIKNKNRLSLSLFNINQKPMIQEFYKFDTIENRIKIMDIQNYTITIKELNSSQKWELKMFDINVSKYKPKESE